MGPTPEQLHAFGTKLAALRAGRPRRWVAEQLALSGMSYTHQTVKNWEDGKHPPNGPTVRTLESIFGTDEGELALLLGYPVGPELEARINEIESLVFQQAKAIDLLVKSVKQLQGKVTALSKQRQ